MSPGISTRLLATQSDDRLLALVREGHERAFEALVQRYRRPLLGYCRRLSLPDARAEDIIQLALLKAWIAIREGADVRDLKAWLYRVVHNTALNAIRDAAHDGDPIADPAERFGAREPDLDHRLAMRDTLAEVAALPAMQREVIVRTAVAGHSHEQVATDLGITDGAVRGLLYRARATLRAAITTLTPPPLLGWIAGRADQGAPPPERLTELAGGGGTVGLGGLLLKGSIVAITAGTVVTGAAVVHFRGTSSPRHPRASLATAAPAGSAGYAGSATGSALADSQLGAARRGAAARLHSHRHSSSRPRAPRGADYPGGSRTTNSGSSGSSLNGRAPRSTTPGSRNVRSGAPTTVTTVQSAPGGSPQEAGTTQSAGGPSVGSSQGGGASQSGGSSQSGGGSSGGSEPVGSAAGAGSGSGSGGSSEQGTGEGSGSSGSGSLGSGSSGSEQSGSGSDSSGSEDSGGSGESAPSGSSGEESDSLVGTVVHEVGSVLEHILH